MPDAAPRVIRLSWTEWQATRVAKKTALESKGLSAPSRRTTAKPLPSVRQLADTIGINMHTVNKAYSVLRQEGFVKVDRRRGAVIAIDIDKLQAMEELKKDMQVLLAKSRCKRISREEVHALIDEIYQNYDGNGGMK